MVAEYRLFVTFLLGSLACKVAAQSQANLRDINEPGIIVLQPASPVHTQGGKLSLSCVAYGEPQLPDIIWSAPSLGVSDFAANGTVLGPNVQVTISNSLLNDSDTNLVFVVSTLELCGVNYTISFVEDFSCQATNGNYNDSTIGMRESDSFTMRPLIFEPATLLAAPSQGQFTSEGPRISATCAAYGSPRPLIQWTQNGRPVMEEESFTNVVTQSWRDQDGDILAISTLEICDPEFEFVPEATVCTVSNGVELEFILDRVQEASFIVDPRTALLSYSVELMGDTALVNFTFSSPQTINNTRCFFDKFIFSTRENSTLPSYTSYQPIYPGLCQQIFNSYEVWAFLDPRDFRPSLPFFNNVDNLFLDLVPLLEINFLPRVSLLPLDVPKQASSLTLNADPRVYSFDVDLYSERVILHFNDYIDVMTFESTELTLTDPVNRNSYQLSNFSMPVMSEDSLIRTICVYLSTEDLESLQNLSICTSIPDECACYFTSFLVSSHSGVPVQAVQSVLPLPVSKLKLPSFSSDPALYMQLSLSYDGCTAVHNLTSDEVYILRDGEVITRIDCFSSGSIRNVNPFLSFDRYEGPLSFSSTPEIDTRYFTLEWPRQAYFSIPGSGLPVDNYGLYTCRTDNTTIQHYIYNMSRYLALPEGAEYRVRLYDAITIPFVLGSDPLINISRAIVEFSLYDVTRNSLASVMPQFQKLSPYRGELFYNRTLLSMSGWYNLRILIGRDVIASVDFNIAVDPPLVSIVPPLVAVVPGDITISLECITSNPSLRVEWLSALDGSLRPLSTDNSYTASAPGQGGFADGLTYYCIVRDPENTSNIVGSASTSLKNIGDELVVLYNGQEVENFGQITVANRQFGNLTLECLGHSATDVTGLMWTSEEQGRDPILLQEDSQNNSYITALYGYNSANLTINNTLRPYRGTVKCRAPTLGRTITIFIRESADAMIEYCEEGDVDSMYGIQWERAAVNTSDGQPCPDVNGLRTEGLAFRACLQGGMWASIVNTTNCQTAQFRQLRQEADEIFSLSMNLVITQLHSSLTMLTDALATLTTPTNQESLLPQDLQTTNYILENIIRVSPTTMLHTGVCAVINNILDPINVDGWTQLNTVAEGSRQLLRSIEAFGAYVLSAQSSDTLLRKKEIVLSAQSFTDTNRDIVFPQLVNSSDGAQVTVPASLLESRQAIGVVSIVMKNFSMFLPQPDETIDNKPRVVGTVVVSIQILPQNSSDFSDNFITLVYNTTRIFEAANPVCSFWNESSGAWDGRAVATPNVEILEGGEFKSFEVECLARHTTAFVVIVEQENEVFDFTIPIYIGCGAVIFSAIVSLFTLLLSCMLDNLRKHAVVAYCTHMSFGVSLISAFVGFLALRIEAAEDSEIGCIAIAAAMHYFFTAAFSWLFCETLVLVFFPFFSKHCSSFIILFLIGWILPAIPTAITLGLLRDDYTISQHCWFFFDGVVENEIVLSFMVPKLAIIAGTLLFLLISCGTTAVRNRRLSKEVSPPLIHMLGFWWFGLVLLLVFLGAVWIFAVLLVNVYGINAVITGWIFMGACIALGTWLILFILIISVMNQKVDYREVWSKEDSSPNDGPRRGAKVQRRGGEYEMMQTRDSVQMEYVDNPISGGTQMGFSDYALLKEDDEVQVTAIDEPDLGDYIEPDSEHVDPEYVDPEDVDQDPDYVDIDDDDEEPIGYETKERLLESM